MALPAPFLSPRQLRERLGEVRVVDCRWSLDGSEGREPYRQGHLPGAVFVDLDAELAAPPSPAAGRHPLPAPQDFAAAMSRAGIGDGDTVVAYDTAGGAIAARLVWMLRVLGHPDVELRQRFLDAGVTPDGETVVHCGSGVTACHDVLAMELAGLPRPRLFVGSWSAWSSDPDRPAATGSGPG